MLNWFEGDLHTNGVRLHYYRSGSDQPPLVMVHGFTDNALYWTRAAQALAPEWDVILYDARGHGASDRTGGRFGDAERVGDLVGLVEALKLHRPGLMGHSMGGATIALVAAQHPELPRFVILEDPAWFEPPPGESAEEAAQRVAARSDEIAAWREWVRGLQNGSREFGLAQIRDRSPNWSEIDQNLSLNARLQVELAVFDSYPQQESPWRRVVSQIQCPILLLIGDNQERSAIITPEQAQEAATLWRKGRWVQIRGAGHSTRYDQFEQYIEAVKTFLREVR
jgi:pimeloyl-ACP methyl ester carboxylesterase